MVAMAAIALAVAACTVDGDPVRVADLGPRVVDSAAFPYGPSTAVPEAQVPNAVADITFTPLSSSNRPAGCTPDRVDSADAQIGVGPGGAAGGTLTVMLAHVSDTLDDYAAMLRDCADFGLGGTVGTRVTTVVGTVHGDYVESARTLTNAGSQYARVYEIVGQEGGVRLYVQNRFAGDTELTPDEEAATRALFDAAKKKAFGG